MILKLNLSLVSRPTQEKLLDLIEHELHANLELEQLKLRFPKFPKLKRLSLRQLRREARDLKRTLHLLERHIKKGGGS